MGIFLLVMELMRNAHGGHCACTHVTNSLTTTLEFSSSTMSAPTICYFDEI